MFDGKEYGPFVTLVVIDKAREKRNEDWLDKMADMMILRKYVSHATEGRILPRNFGYIDVNCFGNQLSNALRFDVKKDLPLTLIFRPLIGGNSGEGIFKRDRVKFNAYSGARYINSLIEGEKNLLMDDGTEDKIIDKTSASKSLGYREVVIDLWDNSCVKKSKSGKIAQEEKEPMSHERDNDDL